VQFFKGNSFVAKILQKLQFCGALLQGIIAGHYCRALLQGIIAGHYCIALHALHIIL
jgi:hypothetical protein